MSGFIRSSFSGEGNLKKRDPRTSCRDALSKTRLVVTELCSNEHAGFTGTHACGEHNIQD